MLDDVAVAIVAPLYVTVRSELGRKFEPVRVTIEPTDPLDGETLMDEAAIVNVADAALVIVSLAYIVWMPVEELGATRVQEKDPVPLLVKLAGDVEIMVESKFNVIAVLGTKFVPVTVTAVPFGPLVGFRLRVRVTKVNVSESEFVPSVDWTVFAPAVVDGTINEQVNEPQLSVITDEGEVVTLVPPNVTDIFALAANPLPIIVT